MQAHPTAADLVAALVEVLAAEERARHEARVAVGRQARILHELRALGLPASTVAHRIAAAQGRALSLADRLRLAGRLRKLAWRRGTSGPAEVTEAHGQPVSVAASSDWAITPEPAASRTRRAQQRRLAVPAPEARCSRRVSWVAARW